MRRSRLTAGVPIVWLMCAVCLWLTLPSGVPAQGRTGRQEAGTARLAGRVVAADSGQPLGRAQVTLTGDGRLVRVATSDRDGRYTFTNLPAGRYTLAATKTGYLRLEYGQRRAFEIGRPVSLSAGQKLVDVDLPLPRGAVITARVLDDRSRPVAGARVRAMRFEYRPDGEVHLADARQFPFRLTDDRGEIRLHGLMPGEYVLSASAPLGQPEAGVDTGVATTFYPGTLSAAEAQPVSLGLGEEIFVQFPLLAARLSRISGTITDSSGRPAAGAIAWLTTYEGSMQSSRGTGAIGGEGAFAIEGVPPGEHWLVVNHRSADEFAALPVTVSGGDIDGLRVTTAPGADITGSVVVDGGDRPGNRLRVRLQQAGPARPAGGPASSEPVGDDGRFRITGATGQVLFDVAGADGLDLRSVRLNGRDVTDQSLDLPPGGVVSGVSIVVSAGLPRVRGSVSDAEGAVVRDYAVVVQPAEALEPTAAARRVHLLRPDRTGRFESAGLRPGRYVATAVESLEEGRQYSRELRARLRPLGQEFHMDEQGDVTLALTLSTAQ